MIGIFPILYLALVTSIGLSHRRGIKTESDFFLARRSGGVLLLTGSLIATMFGSFGVMGVSGLGFRMGFVAAWYHWVGAIGLLLLGGWVLRRVDYGDVFTLPEFLGRGYGQTVRQISAAFIVLAWLAIIAAQLIAAGKILHFMGTASGWWTASAHEPLLIALIALIFVAYTCLGGQHSVLRTDLWQAIAIFAGLTALVIGTLSSHPDALQNVQPELLSFPFGEALGPGRWLILLLTLGVPFLVGPDIYSRLFSGRNRETGRKAVLTAAAVMFPLVFLIVFAGVLGRGVIGSQVNDSETVLLELSLLTVAPFWTGLLLAALLAAVMSSADTCLLTISTLISRDLLDTVWPQLRRDETVLTRSRLIIAVAGVASLAVALWHREIISALMFSYKIYSPAVLCPFLAMVLWPARRFRASTGAASVLLGAGAAGLGVWLETEWLQLAAFGLSALPIAGEIALLKPEPRAE